MKLIIISGSSASGKSAIGKKIASILGYNFISKDSIKEELFDSQSRSTHDYFWYESKARNKFFYFIEQNISRNESIIIESDFMHKDKKQLRICLKENVNAAEVYCSAKGFTRLKRYIKRNESKSRHKGHHDRRWYVPMFVGALLSYVGVNWPYEHMNVSDKRLNIDTTDFSKVNYEDIVSFARQA